MVWLFLMVAVAVVNVEEQEETLERSIPDQELKVWEGVKTDGRVSENAWKCSRRSAPEPIVIDVKKRKPR